MLNANRQPEARLMTSPDRGLDAIDLRTYRFPGAQPGESGEALTNCNGETPVTFHVGLKPRLICSEGSQSC